MGIHLSYLGSPCRMARRLLLISIKKKMIQWPYLPTKLFKTYSELREREMFYLTMHSTHFIYGYMASDIWLRTILIVRKETHCRQQGFFYMHHPTDRITYTTAFVTPVVEHWLEREIAQWVHPMKNLSDDPSHHERTLYL